MKITIKCCMENESWGHLYHNVSQAVTYRGDVIVTLGKEGSVTLSSKEFDNYKRDAILFVIDKLKPSDSTINIQENDAIINKMFISLVDSKYKICNIAYRLNNSY